VGKGKKGKKKGEANEPGKGMKAYLFQSKFIRKMVKGGGGGKKREGRKEGKLGKKAGKAGYRYSRFTTSLSYIDRGKKKKRRGGDLERGSERY